jgi:hypothetical protein
MVHQNRQNLMTKSFNDSFINSTNVKAHAQRKQQINQRSQKPQHRQSKALDLTEFNNTVRELCSMYDAVNYFGKADYASKTSWRIVNKQQLNTASIYAIRYAPVIPKKSAGSRRQSRQQQQQSSRKQSKQQQARQQTRKMSGRRIGGCKYRPNVPRVYSYSTTPLPANLYPVTKDFNHLFDAFNYFGNPQVRNIKSWIESSRTHKLSSIASVFAKRNAPYVPIRRRSSKKAQPQKRQQPRNIPKQQSNKRQRYNGKNKKQMINQQPLSNVWEEYYISPKRSIFK